MKLINSSQKETAYLNRIDPLYLKYSEMGTLKRDFLNILILKKNSKRVLEVGISSMDSSAILLNTIKDNDMSRLYVGNI